MSNGYEAGVPGLSNISIPQGATKQEVSFFERKSAEIAAEKKSQQQLRNQLIEQKLQMNQQVLGKMKPTGYSFDDRTNQALTTLVDQYVDIKNGMMKSESEAGYVGSQEGMRALNQIQEQAGDISFFNNQLSNDLLPHLRKMIGKDAELGYKDSKGAMSTAVPTDIQRLVMNIDNNGDVLWEFTDRGELELVMPAGEKDGVKYDETRLNLNEYGKYIEKGEEFFFDIPDIDDELNAAAEFVVGSPDKPKLDKSTKTYYTYKTARDGKIDFSTIEMTDDNRQRAINDLMQTRQFDHLLYSETRINDRRALWQDCVGEMIVNGRNVYGQNTKWDGSKEQLETLHRWLANTAIDQNLAPGTHVTGMSKRSKPPGGGSGKEVSKKLLAAQDVASQNQLVVTEILVGKKEAARLLKEDPFSLDSIIATGQASLGPTKIAERFNESLGLLDDKRFFIGADIPEEEGELLSGETEEERTANAIYYLRDDGSYKELDIDLSSGISMYNALNEIFIDDEDILNQLSIQPTKKNKKAY